MSENTNTLRQAINTVNITGYLKKMEFKKDTGANGDYISGNLVVETAPHNEIRIDAYANRMTKATPTKPAEETAAYKGLCRVMEEYISMASLMEKGATEEEARSQCTKVVAARANLSINEFWDRTDNLVESVRVISNFFSRVSDDFAPCARFDIEGYVSAKRPEVKGTGDNMSETGRLLIDLVVPVYGGRVVTMKFVTAEDVSSYIDDHYEIGKTVRVYGNMVNSVNVISTRKPGIKEEYETTTTYVNEMVIDNGLPEPYDEEDTNAYNRAAIDAALVVRATEWLPEQKRKQKEREAKKNNGSAAQPTGFAAGFANNNAPTKSTFTF